MLAPRGNTSQGILFPEIERERERSPNTLASCLFLESHANIYYIFTVTPRNLRIGSCPLVSLASPQAGPCSRARCCTQRNNEIDSHEWRIHTAVSAARMRGFINSGPRAIVTADQSAPRDFRSSLLGPDISRFTRAPRRTYTYTRCDKIKLSPRAILKLTRRRTERYVAISRSINSAQSPGNYYSRHLISISRVILCVPRRNLAEGRATFQKGDG